MEIELIYLDDGRFQLDCGDAHRALALWLEQSWFDAVFQQQLQQVYAVTNLPLQIRGPEYVAQIDADEVLIYANVAECEESADEAYQLTLLDAHAGCGYDDFIHLIDYIRQSF